jgi:two-component sensor histidine kinase
MDSQPARTLRTRAARWKTGPHLRTLTLLAVVGAALLGGVVLMWQTIDAERSQRAQATRTNAVLLALRDVSRNATNGETGQRGYFITLDRRYLAPYLVARAQYRDTLARLRDLMGEDVTPHQRDLLDQIDRLNDAKFAEMGETIGEIGEGNLLEARRRILTDEGQDVMERLRRAVGELERLELARFEQARDEATASEARILPILVILMVFIVLALALGLGQVIRTADAEARAANAADLALARDRADLLARELNHRVKNLFAVVLAIVKMTGRDQPEAKPTVDRIADRIHALLMAHEVTQGTSARASAHLADLVEIALKPYRSEDNACDLSGPDLELPERAVVPLGLVLHELTTNAVKYGAWASPGGHLGVTWSSDGEHLRLDWQETRSPAAADLAEQGRKGFGSTLIEGSARQLGGTIRRDYPAGGLSVRIEFPLSA